VTLVRHATAVDPLRDRVRAYVLRAQAASARAEHDQWRDEQPEWERRWGAPSPVQVRDGIFAILTRHGMLDPAAPGRFAGVGRHARLQDWGPEVFAGSVAVGADARAVLVYDDGSDRPADGADFVRLVIPFVQVTGGDWRPAGLRTSHAARPGGRSRVHVEFEHAGRPHHWELHQAPEDGLTQGYLACVADFGRNFLPGEFIIRNPGEGELTVTYVPAALAGEIRAFLRGWPSAAQLVAMVRQDAPRTWGERGGNRVYMAGRRLGLQPPDYNAATPDGTRPLHEAARLGQAATVRVMLRGGADPRLPDGAGRQAADLAGDPGLRDYILSWAGRRLSSGLVTEETAPAAPAPANRPSPRGPAGWPGPGRRSL
jgi:hypothetical protein